MKLAFAGGHYGLTIPTNRIDIAFYEEGLFKLGTFFGN